MSNPTREDLLGYLIGAIEPQERQQVEDALTTDLRLRRELDLLHQSLEPLSFDRAFYDPPLGLAARTCQYVSQHRTRMPALTPVGMHERAANRGWSWVDMAVAAGIFVAASLLIFPAVGASRIQAQMAACQNNLRLVGNSLIQYSESDPGRLFPVVHAEGKQACAGIYGPTLVDGKFLDDERALICPADGNFANDRDFHVPSIADIEAAQGGRLQELQERMGGSYGYTLGYMDRGRYRPTKNLHRANFALMSDAPAEDRSTSFNHGGCGQNVLFEDGHVEYLTGCQLRNTGDHVFRNYQGLVAPGLHVNDSVISMGPMYLDGTR